MLHACAANAHATCTGSRRRAILHLPSSRIIILTGDRSALPLHDDPVSAARQHAQRTRDPLVAGDQQSLAAGGGAAAAAAEAAQQQLALQQASAAEDLSTLVLYIFSPTDPGEAGINACMQGNQEST